MRSFLRVGHTAANRLTNRSPSVPRIPGPPALDRPLGHIGFGHVVHRTPPGTRGPVTDEMLDAAVAEGVRETDGLDWKRERPRRVEINVGSSLSHTQVL